MAYPRKDITFNCDLPEDEYYPFDKTEVTSPDGDSFSSKTENEQFVSDLHMKAVQENPSRYGVQES